MSRGDKTYPDMHIVKAIIREMTAEEIRSVNDTELVELVYGPTFSHDDLQLCADGDPDENTRRKRNYLQEQIINFNIIIPPEDIASADRDYLNDCLRFGSYLAQKLDKNGMVREADYVNARLDKIGDRLTECTGPAELSDTLQLERSAFSSNIELFKDMMSLFETFEERFPTTEQHGAGYPHDTEPMPIISLDCNDALLVNCENRNMYEGTPTPPMPINKAAKQDERIAFDAGLTSFNLSSPYTVREVTRRLSELQFDPERYQHAADQLSRLYLKGAMRLYDTDMAEAMTGFAQAVISNLTQNGLAIEGSKIFDVYSFLSVRAEHLTTPMTPWRIRQRDRHSSSSQP